MSKWKAVTLAEVAEINPAWSPEAIDRDEVVSFVPMSAVSADTASVADQETRRLGEVLKGYTTFADGDVLVAKITPCFENGKIAQARLAYRYGFGSTEFHVVRARPERADSRYLLRFLRQDRIRREGERKMTGSAGQRRVPRHFLDTLEVPLPPLPEQRRIAAVLDRAEALRAKRRASLAHLDTLTHAIFLGMVGDLRSNSKSWPVCRLETLLLDGPQNGLYRPACDYGTGVPILRIDAFYDGYVTDMTALKRLRASEDDVKRYGLREDDIVINRVNSMEYLGKSALIPVLSEPTVFESNMMRLTLDPAQAHPRYIVEYLQTPEIKSQIRTAAKHAVNQSSINQQDVKGFQLLVPPLPLQQEFAHRVAAVERLKSAHRKSLALLDELFLSLQHRAFRGEL